MCSVPVFSVCRNSVCRNSNWYDTLRLQLWMSVLRNVLTKLQRLTRRCTLSKSDNGAMEQPSNSVSSPPRSEEWSTSREGSPTVNMSIPNHELHWPFDQLSSESRTRTSISENSYATNGKQDPLDGEITYSTAKVAYIFSKDDYPLYARTIQAGKVAQKSRSRSSPATSRW